MLISDIIITMKKVSIFVDVQNIYYTTKQQFNSNFDYNKFWKLVTTERQVIGAFAYTTDRGNEKQIQFQNILRAIGFEVKLKPFISRSDGSAKGDWDVGIKWISWNMLGSQILSFWHQVMAILIY